MTLTDFVERVGRTIFEAPFGGGKSRAANHAELAEIRHAILEEIERKSYRTSGRNLFPYNRVRILIRGADEQQSAALQGDFLREYFSNEVLQFLARKEAEFPEHLRVDFEVSNERPAKGESWLTVLTSFEEPAAPPEQPEIVGRLIVMEGAASERMILLDRPRTNIGRTLDVYRKEGLSRRNHLIFDEDDEVSRTVSREHAHIDRDPSTGDYRLFNDRFYDREKRESCNVWIIRDGASQEVHRNTRGAKLQDGDEIHLGKAALRFRIEAC
jgi:pSer/pThr/pTyr-binding forkhead associated (FHA) protein